MIFIPFLMFFKPCFFHCFNGIFAINQQKILHRRFSLLIRLFSHNQYFNCVFFANKLFFLSICLFSSFQQLGIIFAK